MLINFNRDEDEMMTRHQPYERPLLYRHRHCRQPQPPFVPAVPELPRVALPTSSGQQGAVRAPVFATLTFGRRELKSRRAPP